MSEKQIFDKVCEKIDNATSLSESYTSGNSSRASVNHYLIGNLHLELFNGRVRVSFNNEILTHFHGQDAHEIVDKLYSLKERIKNKALNEFLNS